MLSQGFKNSNFWYMSFRVPRRLIRCTSVYFIFFLCTSKWYRNRYPHKHTHIIFNSCPPKKVDACELWDVQDQTILSGPQKRGKSQRDIVRTTAISNLRLYFECFYNRAQSLACIVGLFLQNKV